MDYQIVRVDETGCGYAVVTLSNGETFGQSFHAPAVTNDVEFFATVEAQLQEAVERITPKPAPVIDARILSQIGVTRQLVEKPIGGRDRG